MENMKEKIITKDDFEIINGIRQYKGGILDFDGNVLIRKNTGDLYFTSIKVKGSLISEGYNVINTIKGGIESGGNIKFDNWDLYSREMILCGGDLIVGGNIRAGYAISAKGNIRTSGVGIIEAGGTLDAGKDISAGISITARGDISAIGNISTREFIIGRNIESQGEIEAESVISLRSNIKAKSIKAKTIFPPIKQV